MKKIFLLSAIALVAVTAHAQTVSLVPGKTISAVITDKKTITVSQMGQDMEMPSSTELYSDFIIKSVDGKKITLTSTIKRINVSLTMMGQEMKIDSQDSATLSNPQYADALKDINKPKDVTIELGKSQESPEIDGLANEENMAISLFLPFDKNVKVGTTVSDSTQKENGSKSVNTYAVTQSTKDEITVTATSNAKITGTKQQMGMDVKQNMQITTTAVRIYDVATGLLKSETKNITGSGTNEVQSMSIPVTMKGSSTMTIK